MHYQAGGKPLCPNCGSKWEPKTSEISRGVKLHHDWVAAWKECYLAIEIGILMPWVIELFEASRTKGLTSNPDVGCCLIDGKHLDRFPRLHRALGGVGVGGKASGRAAPATEFGGGGGSKTFGAGRGVSPASSARASGGAGGSGGKPFGKQAVPHSPFDLNFQERLDFTQNLTSLKKAQMVDPKDWRIDAIENIERALGSLPPAPVAATKPLQKAKDIDANFLSKLQQCTHRVQELQKRSDTFKKASESLSARMHELQGQEVKASADAARIASECATERELQASLYREVAEIRYSYKP